MADVFIAKDIQTIIDKTDFSRLGNNVGIKVHFGEMGCVTYMNPEIVKAVYKKVISLGKKATLIESNVLYKGSRTNSTDHKKTAIEHGFDFAPIEILDGEMGDEFIEVPIENGFVTSAKIGIGIKQFDSMIAIAHFKGHDSAGYGGAFKTLGMGIGSRAGKLHMHAGISPSVKSSECIGCTTCRQGCDFGAIDMVEGKAIINPEKCVGCAMCIAVCPTNAVQIPWGDSTNEELQKKIVDYSAGVFKIIPLEKSIFINIMEKITKECDCFGVKQIPMMPDVGILESIDPVALDKACLDLAKEHSHNDFDKLNSSDNYVQVKHAEELGLGSQEYNLIEL